MTTALSSFHKTAVMSVYADVLYYLTETVLYRNCFDNAYRLKREYIFLVLTVYN